MQEYFIDDAENIYWESRYGRSLAKKLMEELKLMKCPGAGGGRGVKTCTVGRVDESFPKEEVKDGC